VFEALEVPIELVDRPEQSIRQHIPDELVDELAESISRVGLLEPPVCERVEGRYRIIAGDRRLLACKRAGLTKIPIIIREGDSQQVVAVQTHENLFRSDMTPIEEARLFSRLYAELGEDIELVAGKVRLSVSYVDKRLSLLQGYPEVIAALDEGKISIGVAEALNSISKRAYALERLDVAMRGGATVALARRWAAELNGLASIQAPESEQKETAPAEAPYVPLAESLACWFCEGNHDLHTLQMVSMHPGCIAALNNLLKKIGRET